MIAPLSQNNLSLSLPKAWDDREIRVEKLARKARSFRSQHVVYSKAYTDAKTITFPFPPTSDLCSFQSPDVSMSPVHGSIPSQRDLGRDAINELP